MHEQHKYMLKCIVFFLYFRKFKDFYCWNIKGKGKNTLFTFSLNASDPHPSTITYATGRVWQKLL